MQILCLVMLTLISGRVLDGKTGEPVALARVSIGDVSVVTGSDGMFIIPDASLPAAINVTAVGYATSKKTVRTTDDITVVLVPEGAELKESVTVTTTPFEGLEPAAASERRMCGPVDPFHMRHGSGLSPVRSSTSSTIRMSTTLPRTSFASGPWASTSLPSASRLECFLRPECILNSEGFSAVVGRRSEPNVLFCSGTP
jgi:hypothetical protein